MRVHMEDEEEEEEMSREEAGWKWPDQQKRHKKYKSVSSSSPQPNMEDQAKFWKSWNAWYKKQIDVKEQVFIGLIICMVIKSDVSHSPFLIKFLAEKGEI